MEFPRLEQIQKRFGPQGLRVVMVTPESAMTVSKVAPLTRTPITVLIGGEKVLSQYGVEGTPHTVVFDGKGQRRADLEIPGFSEEGLDQVTQRCSSGELFQN